jgi:hypothetical protein
VETEDENQRELKAKAKLGDKVSNKSQTAVSGHCRKHEKHLGEEVLGEMYDMGLARLGQRWPYPTA